MEDRRKWQRILETYSRVLSHLRRHSSWLHLWLLGVWNFLFSRAVYIHFSLELARKKKGLRLATEL